MHRKSIFPSLTCVASIWLVLSATAFAQQPQDEKEPPGKVSAKEDADAETPGQGEPVEQEVEEKEGQLEQEEDELTEEEDGHYDYEAYEQEEAEAEAMAQVVPGREQPARRPAGELGAELGIYYRSDHVGSLFQLTPLLAGWVDVSEGLDITLQWGFAFRGMSPDSGDARNTFIVGNPLLGIRGVLQQGRTEIRYGIGCTAPAAQLPEEPQEADADFEEKENAYYIASAMRGRYNHWLWMPEQVAIVLHGGGDMVTESHIFLGGEAALAIIIPAGDYRNNTGTMVFQGAGEIGFGFDELLFFDRTKMAARLQLFSLPVGGEDDKFQVSIGPVGRAELGNLFLSGSFLVNFDKPDGLWGDGGDIWGLYIGGGAIFP